MIRLSNIHVLLFWFASVSFIQSPIFSQGNKTPFIGTLTYRITICDTALQKFVPTRYMKVSTNDTLIRIENETDRLGKQVVIKHMLLQKSYLLLETALGKYAIQTDHSLIKADTIFPYSFRRKPGKLKICGLKAKKVLVSHKGFTEPLVFYYVKSYSSKYLNTFENAPGLPVLYYIPTNDGLYKYELTDMDFKIPDHDLFGIPSDFNRVTFDKFMDDVMKSQEMPKGQEENK